MVVRVEPMGVAPHDCFDKTDGTARTIGMGGSCVLPNEGRPAIPVLTSGGVTIYSGILPLLAKPGQVECVGREFSDLSRGRDGPPPIFPWLAR